jgi:hypothetical protein
VMGFVLGHPSARTSAPTRMPNTLSVIVAAISG